MPRPCRAGHVRRYLLDVRGRALDALEQAVLDDDGGGRPLLAGGFVYGMVVQHEHQHDETMLATLQLMAGDGYRPLAPSPPGAADPPPSGEVFVPGGPFVMGANTSFALDDERPAHVEPAPSCAPCRRRASHQPHSWSCVPIEREMTADGSEGVAVKEHDVGGAVWIPKGAATPKFLPVGLGTGDALDGAVRRGGAAWKTSSLARSATNCPYPPEFGVRVV